MTAANTRTALKVPIVSKLRRPAAQLSGPGWQHSLKIFHYRRDPNIAYFPSRAKNHFHGAFGNLVSHRDSKGDTDQVRVLELHPGPFVAVIEDHIKACRFQLFRNVDGSAK